MRPIINDMDEETFKLFIEYHFSTCERPDLLGASAHTLDILIKKEDKREVGETPSFENSIINKSIND
ncbi:hypothetical protein SDC9_209461 [bioreactor metagenome]|uniref:Uncharacterized protein n=1 Tax=bioreactor metagenome TaxID=1076179 RepID=A0A645JGC0_9ZZZZ